MALKGSSELQINVAPFYDAIKVMTWSNHDWYYQHMSREEITSLSSRVLNNKQLRINNPLKMDQNGLYYIMHKDGKAWYYSTDGKLRFKRQNPE